VRWRGAGQPVVVPSRVGLSADRWRDGFAALDRPPPARQRLAKRARLSGLRASLSPRAEALRRSASGLPEHGVDHLHDEALLGLGQAMDALDLLQKLWRGPALRALRIAVTVHSTDTPPLRSHQSPTATISPRGERECSWACCRGHSPIGIVW